MYNLSGISSRGLFLLLMSSAILTTGCADEKRAFIRTETYLADKTISKIELSASRSSQDKRYLVIKGRKILQQKEFEAYVYHIWDRHVKGANPASYLFFPLLPLQLVLDDTDSVIKDYFGYVGPWRDRGQQRFNKRATGRIVTSASNDFLCAVDVRAENNYAILPLDKEGAARLYLPVFIEKTYKKRPGSNISIAFSVSEYDPEARKHVEAKTYYTVTKQYISELDIVSQKWLKADRYNELGILEKIAKKGNEKACYLVGASRYKSWNGHDPSVRDSALEYLMKVETVDDKFMDRTYLNEMLGHIYASKMDYDTAITYFKRQDTYYSNKMLGMVYKNKKHYKTAKQYFERAMTLTDDSSDMEFLESEMTDLDFSIIVNNDKDLMPEIRKEKYLKKLGRCIQEEKYRDTFLYFSLLDNLAKSENISLPKSLSYFKGFVYYTLKDTENASVHLNAYLKASDKDDKYYGNALDMILEIESSEL